MTKQPNAVLAFDASGPALALPFCGRARGTLRLDGRELASVWRPRGQAWVGEAAPWELTVDAPVSGAWRLTLRNTSAAPARLGTVTFPHFAPEAFSPRLASEEFRELISGGSFVSVTSGVKGVGRMQGRIDFKAASNMVGVYQRDDGEALLLGVLPPEHPYRCELRERTLRFANQVVARQQESGLFAGRNRKYLGYHHLVPGLFHVARACPDQAAALAPALAAMARAACAKTDADPGTGLTLALAAAAGLSA